MDSHLRERPIDSFVSRSREMLKKEYLVIGKTRVSSLTSATVLAFFLGMTLTIGFLASRTGTFEASEAAGKLRPRGLRYGTCFPLARGQVIPKNTAAIQYKSCKTIQREGKKRVSFRGYQLRTCQNCQASPNTSQCNPGASRVLFEEAVRSLQNELNGDGLTKSEIGTLVIPKLSSAAGFIQGCACTTGQPASFITAAIAYIQANSSSVDISVVQNYLRQARQAFYACVAPKVYSLFATPTSVILDQAGGVVPITVSWSSYSTSTVDWIGVFSQGAGNNDQDIVQNQRQLTNAAPSGTLTFTAPASAGIYEFRLNRGESSPDTLLDTLLATSNAISVSLPPSIALVPTLVYSAAKDDPSQTDFSVCQDIYGKAVNIGQNGLICLALIAHPNPSVALYPNACDTPPVNGISQGDNSSHSGYYRMDSQTLIGTVSKEPQWVYKGNNAWDGHTNWEDLYSKDGNSNNDIVVKDVKLNLYVYDQVAQKRSEPALIQYTACPGEATNPCFAPSGRPLGCSCADSPGSCWPGLCSNGVCVPGCNQDGGYNGPGCACNPSVSWACVNGPCNPDTYTCP